MRYEADERHAEMICKGVGLESSSKGLDRPSVKETIEEVMNEERECPLSPEETGVQGGGGARELLGDGPT